MHQDHEHDHDRGLELDLPTMMGRRRALRLLGGAGLGAGLLAVVGCGSSSSDAGTTSTTAASASAASSAASGSSSTSTTVAGTATDATTCTEIPEETAGPYPGDGSNGPDVLGESGVVRSDITSSFGGMTGTAEGVPLLIRMKLLDVAGGCVAMPGAAVYAWHCDRDGNYSLYSKGITDQNYLRGVQAAGDDGWVTFESIFPGCYSGRWPHIHFEVYESLEDAGNVKNKTATSQIALPQDACEAVYATDGYSSSARNLSSISLKSDNVFSDGWTTQLGVVDGDVASGYVVQLNVGV